MSTGAFALAASRLLFGALATFFAILLWSKTRDMAWIFIIAGTIVLYADRIIATLDDLGIIDAAALAAGGIALVPLLLGNLPLIFFTVGFIAAIARHRIR